MPYLVDSDIMIDLTRGSIAAADYLDSLANAWSISMITCLELIAGARTQRETTDLDLVLSGYRAIPPNEDITRRAYYLMKTSRALTGCTRLTRCSPPRPSKKGSRSRPGIASTSR